VTELVWNLGLEALRTELRFASAVIHLPEKIDFSYFGFSDSFLESELL